MSTIKLALLAVCCAAGLGMTHAANAGGWLDHALRHDGFHHHGHDRYSISIGLSSGYYGGGYHSSYYRPRSYYYAPRRVSYYDYAPAYYAYYDSYPGYYDSSYDDDYPVDYGYYGPSSYYGGSYYIGSYYSGGYRHDWDRDDRHGRDHDSWHDHDGWRGHDRDGGHDHSHGHDHDHGPPHH